MRTFIYTKESLFGQHQIVCLGQHRYVVTFEPKYKIFGNAGVLYSGMSCDAAHDVITNHIEKLKERKFPVFHPILFAN